jgi:hypothetical protein
MQEPHQQDKQFGGQAAYFGGRLSLDDRKIREAFQDRRESLAALFNAAVDAKPRAAVAAYCITVVAVPALLVFPWMLAASIPISAAIMIADFRSASKKSKTIGEAVCREVVTYQTRQAPSPRTT